jgi:hypothetical protein
MDKVKAREFTCYAMIFFNILLCSGADPLTYDKTVLTVGWLLFTGLYFYLENLIKPSFLILSGFFVLLSGIYFISNGAYNQVTYIGFFMKIYLAYFCRDLSKENFSYYFVNYVFIVTCLGLPCFFIQLLNFDFAYQIFNLFGNDYGNEIRHSTMFFTILPIHETRNSGFMWEPGAFAAVVTLCLFINIFKHGEKLSSWRNLIFILAILTTKSTMGYMSLLVPASLLMWEAMSKNETLKRLAIVVVPTLLLVFYVVFSNVDFLHKKMVAELEGVDEEMALIEQGNRDNFIVAATRTTSVLLDMRTIVQYPILGLGIDMLSTGEDKQATSSMTERACGLTAILMRFGALGGLFYVIFFYRKAFFEQTIHRVAWVFLLCFILFSNELSESSLLHLFIF